MFEILKSSDNDITDGIKYPRYVDEFIELEDTHIVMFVVKSKLYVMLKYLMISSKISNSSIVEDNGYIANVSIPFSLLTLNRYYLESCHNPPKSPSNLLEILAIGEYSKDVSRYRDNIFDTFVEYIRFSNIEYEGKTIKISSKMLVDNVIVDSGNIPNRYGKRTYYTLSTRHVNDVCDRANREVMSHSISDNVGTFTTITQVIYEPIYSLCPTDKLEDMEKIFLCGDGNKYLRVIDRVDEIRGDSK